MSSTETTASNPAVLRCIAAYKRRYEAEFAKRQDKVRAELAAEAEYRRVMPHLTDRNSIQDFIACVGHGMLIGTIEGRFGPKYLYAAQVALSAVERESRPVGRPGNSPKPTPTQPSATSIEPERC